MRRIFTLITVFIVLVGIVSATSLSIYGAVGESQLYSLTIEETIALINASDFTMIVTYDDGSTYNYSGGAYTATVLEYGSNEYVAVRLPETSHPTGKTIRSIDLTFPFSITISDCTSVFFPVSVGSWGTGQGLGTVSYSLPVFQVDNTNAPVGSQVVYEGSFGITVDATIITNNTLLSDGIYNYYVRTSTFDPLNPCVAALALLPNGNSSFSLVGDILSTSFNRYIRPVTFTMSDVTHIGFHMDISGGFPTTSSYQGVALIFPELEFYANSWSTSPEDPDDPSSGGDYKEQLDEIYNELVKQGKIQQAQNDAILQGQKDIEDSINQGFAGLEDTLTNPNDDNSEWQDNFDTDLGDLDKELDDLTDGLEVEYPDINMDDYDITKEDWWTSSTTDIQSIFDLVINNFWFVAPLLFAIGGFIIIKILLYGTG